MTLAETLVSRNALLGRYAFSQLRPMACTISVGIYLTISVLIFMLAFAGCYEGNTVKVGEFWKAMFVSFAVLQVAMLWILGMYHAGSAVQQEISEKSMDFFRLLPLSAADKIVGVLVGRNLVTLALGAVNTLILLACGFLSGVGTLQLLEFIVFTWVMAAAAMLAAFLAATFESRRRISSSPALVLVLSVFFLPYAIAVAADWQHMFPDGAAIQFFGAKIHPFAFFTALALYACAWFVLGLMRRFANERAALFTPAGAGLCLAGTLLIGFGLGWKYFLEGGESAVLVFWMGTGLAALIIALGAFRGWDDYLESAGRTSVRPGLSRANLSNPALAMALLLLWGAVSLVADLAAGLPVRLAALPVLITFWLVLLCMMEFSVAYAALTLRVRVLAGFTAGLYCALPPIVSAVTDNSFFLLLSPFGYIVRLDKWTSESLVPALANALWLMVLGGLIRRRYRTIAVSAR